MNNLGRLCIERPPAGLPPIDETPLPRAELQLVPIRYTCTYTNPDITIVHTDHLGTTLAALPLAALLLWITTRITAGHRKSIEDRTAKSS